MYKCIKGFALEKCDDNGFTIEGEYTVIEEGSIWNIPENEDYRLIDGEIRLEEDKNLKKFHECDWEESCVMCRNFNECETEMKSEKSEA